MTGPRRSAEPAVDLLGPPRVLGEGLGLLEAPAWHGDSLYFVAVSRGLVYWMRGGGIDVYARTGGGPNGLAFDAAGTLWVAQNGGQRTRRPATVPAAPGLQRVDVGIPTTVLSTGYDAPNDIAVGPDLAIYLTDPPVDPVHHTPLPGRLCRYDPATGDEQVVDSGRLFPNGLAFGPHDGDLYLVETGRRRILRYRTGDLSAPPQPYAQLDHGEPDGICFDVDGRLYVANGPGDDLAIVEPGGSPVRYLPLAGAGIAGERFFPTNCCFGGEDLRTLYVTLASGGRLLGFDATVPGVPLPVPDIFRS